MSASNNIKTTVSPIVSDDFTIGSKPAVMGILNITPDSFSDGGKYYSFESALKMGVDMADQGADIIDVGGESSRPGAVPVTAEEEIMRVIPVIEKLNSQTSVPISIDTCKSEVARAACKAGATIINDISALGHDPKIAEVASEYDSWLVLMHMRGTPETMQKDIRYDNLIEEITSYLNVVADKAIAAGVRKKKIILDPGIGFGKTVEHNLQILKNLSKIKQLGFPILIGASRKSFIGTILDADIDNRLDGSLAAAVYSVINGTEIVRVHDVLPTVRALKIIEKIKRSN